jgi:hypothetical protein
LAGTSKFIQIAHRLLQFNHPNKERKVNMSTGTLVAGPLSKIGRTELAQIPVPQATATHRPVPHYEIVEALVETLSFRHIAVVNEEYAASNDGMKMFGVLDLETQMEGCRFSIGIRNSHDKSLRLGLTAGLRVFVCSNMAFSGDFTPGTMGASVDLPTESSALDPAGKKIDIGAGRVNPKSRP